jgi:pSer/pThr/pTyr-binding forkhead associated (FHA) protein
MGVHSIGRDPASAICVDDETVSRRHARLVIGEDENCWLEDLGSKNGTFVRGRRVSRRARIRDGDEIRIGSASLIYRTSVGGESTRTLTGR